MLYFSKYHFSNAKQQCKIYTQCIFFLNQYWNTSRYSNKYFLHVSLNLSFFLHWKNNLKLSRSLCITAWTGHLLVWAQGETPAETVEPPSLRVFKTQQDAVLCSLIWLSGWIYCMALGFGVGLDQRTFQGPFQPKWAYAVVFNFHLSCYQ